MAVSEFILTNTTTDYIWFVYRVKAFPTLIFESSFSLLTFFSVVRAMARAHIEPALYLLILSSDAYNKLTQLEV